jgi:multidrug efflux system outer membrane protein
MGPDYVRPPVPEPEDYREEFPPGEAIANVPWWEMFGDTVLVDLVDEALVNNRDLLTAVGRIEAARAQLGIVRSDLFPRLDYFGNGAVSGNTEEDGTSWDATLGLSAFWQIDLWGRIRRSNEAALNELLATEEAYRGLTIALVAEVANAYLLLCDLDNRLKVSRQTLVAWQDNVDVIQSRFDAGMVSEIDLNQAQIQVFQAEVSVQTFERLIAQTENALSVLIGAPPQSIERGLPLIDQELNPDIPSGLPSELLARRPDVLQAERQLHAQTARIGVAEALKFPQFNLLGNLGAAFNGGEVGFFDLGAEFFGPIYNAGLNQRQVDVQIALTEQLVNQYEQTILQAYREVNDAMVAVRTYGLEYESRSKQVAAAQNAADLSWVLYEGGMASYLVVLDLQRSLFSSQLAASETRQLELTSIVQLYTALGGGWVAAQDTMGVFGEMQSE